MPALVLDWPQGRASTVRIRSTAVDALSSSARRLRDELDDDRIRLDKDAGVRNLVLDELDYARRILMSSVPFRATSLVGHPQPHPERPGRRPA